MIAMTVGRALFHGLILFAVAISAVPAGYLILAVVGEFVMRYERAGRAARIATRVALLLLLFLFCVGIGATTP